jgi:hypothetical protein
MIPLLPTSALAEPNNNKSVDGKIFQFYSDNKSFFGEKTKNAPEPSTSCFSGGKNVINDLFMMNHPPNTVLVLMFLRLSITKRADWKGNMRFEACSWRAAKTNEKKADGMSEEK